MKHGLNSLNHRGRAGAGCLVGIEVGPAVLRASVFISGPELVGKMKLSTKPERGVTEVIERIERCVRYAVDESDRSFESVAAIGVAVPGGVVSETGEVNLERDFGWHSVPLKKRLEIRLGRPVFVGNVFSLAALAVAAMEASASGRNGGLGVLIPGSVLGAGVVSDGESKDLSAYPKDKPLLPDGAGNVVHRTLHRRYQSFRARDFRKAIRSGDKAAGKFMLQSVRAAMKFGARLVRRGVVRRLVLAGGALDENKTEALAEARRVLRAELSAAGLGRLRIPVITSDLGDQAALMGAAILAERGASAEKADLPARRNQPQGQPAGSSNARDSGGATRRRTRPARPPRPAGQ